MTPPTTPLPIDRATPEDLPAVLALLERCDLPGDGLAEHFGNALVMREGTTVVGCAALEVYGTDALLRSVAVERRLRGQDAGASLTRAALELARSLEVTRVYLLTLTARDFFPRFGFVSLPREEVPASVRQSIEFTAVCCRTATAMVLELRP